MSTNYKDIIKEYLTISKKPENLDFTHVSLTLWYNADATKRGFYVRVDPIKKTNNIVSYCPCDGVNVILPIPVTRYSSKKASEALKFYNVNKKQLVSFVSNKFNLTVDF